MVLARALLISFPKLKIKNHFIRRRSNMKKLAIIAGILLLTVISYPAFARGPGYGGGGDGYGPGPGPGFGPGYCWNTNGGPGNLSSEQRVKLDKLRYAFLGDTADLRNKIWSKSSEMDKLLNSANPDEKQIRDLQKEISALKAEMGDKRISYELEAKKIAPEAVFNGGYGRGPGMMRFYQNQGGPGRGYGPGSCWY